MYPKVDKFAMPFEGVDKKGEYFERFVAQAIALSRDVDVYHPHTCGSSYDVLYVMSFENIHKKLFAKKLWLKL